MPNRPMCASAAMAAAISPMGPVLPPARRRPNRMDLPRSPSFRLDGKRALVTGGTRGIGLGAAVALAEAGAAVTIAARTAGDIETVVNQMADAGLSGEGVALDITDRAAVKTFVDDVEPFQVLVNS